MAQAMKKGKGVREVALEFGVTEAHVLNVMKDALRMLHESVATILQNWTTVSLAREEEILSKLWARMFDENGVPDGEIIGMVQDVILMEQKILSFTAAANKDNKGSSVVQNVTIVGGNPLYVEAMDAFNQHLRTEGEVRDPTTSALDNVIPGGVTYKVLT